MKKLHIDIETRSCCDLRTCGVYVYAEHPTTEITTICWALDDEPVQRWWFNGRPDGRETWRQVLQADIDAAGVLVAHNAGFERIMLSGKPGRALGLVVDGDPDGWDCTAARAAACGLPRTLEGAARCLGVAAQKDEAGHRLMLQMCKPKPNTGPGHAKPAEWFDDAERMDRLVAYCAQDVEVERALDAALPALIPDERETWLLTERMNDRGIAVDGDLLVRVALLIDDASRSLNARIKSATKGAVPRVTDHAALTRWLVEQGVPDAEDGVSKAAIEAMLSRGGNEGLAPDTDLDKLIREVLIMRREGGKSSASKYRAILRRVSADGRIRGVLVYCGAAATGRWSSRGAQLHNLPRGGALKDIDGAIADILGDTPLDMIEVLHGPGLVVASELLRPVFVSGQETA